MDGMLNKIYKILTPEEQWEFGQKLYAMGLKFRLRISFRPDDILPDVAGLNETIEMPQESIYKFECVNRAVPDTKTLTACKSMIAKSFAANPQKKCHLISVDFAGYDYIYAVAPEQTDAGTPTKEALRAMLCLGLDIGTVTTINDPDGAPVMAIGDTWLPFPEAKHLKDVLPEEYSQFLDNLTEALWGLYQQDQDDPEAQYITAKLYESLETMLEPQEG